MQTMNWLDENLQLILDTILRYSIPRGKHTKRKAEMEALIGNSSHVISFKMD
jgi:hypothetical protein